MALDLARWQFGITTVYHFFFVPITIGMAFLIAGFQTAWVRTGHDRWLKLTKFYGKLFLINVAIGVVTGIWQEFQFGMNWSAYSRFVGDIFGAPLAMEALLAFFVEATFIGLWIFGWDLLKPRVHLATIWLVAMGTVLSAFFILAANSWMQHPVGFHYNPVTHRAELSSFLAVLTNPMFLVTFPHTIAAAFLTGGGVIAGVAMWRLVRSPAARAAVQPGQAGAVKTSAAEAETAAFRSAAKVGSITVLIAAVATAITGDTLGKIMTDYQPMKMAAAEALYHTSQPASFSLFTIGTLNGSREVFSIRIPGLLSFLGTGSFNGRVDGIDNIQALYSHIYGPGSYMPVIPVTYWSFRLMIGAGMLAALIALAGLWALRGGRVPRSRWLLAAVLLLPLLPLTANSFGWIFTEMGRQPWIVFGQMKTAAGISSNSAGSVLASLITLTVVYAVFIVVRLMIKSARAGLPDEPPAHEGEDKPLSFAYLRSSGEVPCISAIYGSSPSPRCGPATSCWRDSTSAWASCFRCSAGTTPSGACSSTPSARSGTAMRPG
jgi:cytochrome d ubiquinol oxidase subunit I